MNTINRLLVVFAAAILFTACPSEPPSGGDAGPGDGGSVADAADTGSAPGADTGGTNGNDTGGSSNGSDSGGMTDIDWTGTWNVQLDYDVTCTYISNEKSGSNQHTEAVDLTGSNSSLTLEIDNYRMNGTGDNESVTLSGDFPVRDYDGEEVGIDGSSSMNDITFRLTSVQDENTASGEVSGSFENSTGWECDIDEGGTVTFTR